MNKRIKFNVLREIALFAVLSFFVSSCDVAMKGNVNIQVNNNSNVNTQLDEFIRIQNEKEVNAVRANANYSNLSTNELERRLKEGVKNVK